MKTSSKNNMNKKYLGFAILLIGGTVTGFKAGQRTTKAPSERLVAKNQIPSPRTKNIANMPQNNNATNPVKPAALIQPPAPSQTAPSPSANINMEVAERKIIFGKSVQGRPLKAYILGDGPNTTLFFGAFHGNEPATPHVVEKLREYLKKNPDKWRGCRIILAPRVNPDGLNKGTRVNAHGVDINRNFPYGWQPKARAARYDPGPKAMSEPETKAVINLLDRYNPQKIVSIHQPLHTLNYTGAKGHEMARIMAKFSGSPITDDIGYPTPGSFGDYCGKQRGIGIVTQELTNESAATAWNINKEAYLAVIKMN